MAFKELKPEDLVPYKTEYNLRDKVAYDSYKFKWAGAYLGHKNTDGWFSSNGKKTIYVHVRPMTEEEIEKCHIT